jgi:DNA-binding transcriptional MerR regulator
MRYSIMELARATGIPIRTLRAYVQQGIVPPLVGALGAEGARSNAQFGEEQFYRACAANALRKRDVGVRAIKAQLDGASDAELCAIAGLPAPPRQISPEEIEKAHRSHGDGHAHAHAHAAPRQSREPWTRVVLRPGVELHVRADADADALAVARAIEDEYARDAIRPTASDTPRASAFASSGSRERTRAGKKGP